jgi:threonine dehydratase
VPELLQPRRTTFVEPLMLCRRLGVELVLASETLQYTGSFKYRAARQVAATVPNDHVITASSGNFGQAIAFACQQAGKRCTVVMPATSSQVKIDNVRGYGATVDLVDTTQKQREERVAELAASEPGAYVASAYDDPLVIQGNSSLGREIAEWGRRFDIVVCPVGGAGLASGLLSGFRKLGYETRLIGAEPLMANDAARTLRSGQIEINEFEPQTLADGARTRSIGKHNWAVLQGSIDSIVEVPEERIREAVRLLFLEANLKSEPTGALSVAALLTQPEIFSGKSVLCVISGGNVEPALYASLIV